MSARAPAVILAVAVALAFADSSIVMLGLPEIYGELEATIGGVSLVITAYNVAVVVGAIAAIPLVRRVAPGPLVAVGLAVFAAASLGCGLAPSLEALVALRAAQGVGGAVILVASLPVLTALGPTPAAGRALWGTAGTLGAVLGPAVGGLVTELGDWRAIFIAQAPVAALALVAVREPRARALAADPRRERLSDPWASLGLVFAFGALVGALFLAVLMVVTVWGLGPLAGAVVVSALPVAALAVQRPARALSPAPGAVVGALALAAGLATLAFLPAVSNAWAAGALAVCGAGFGLLVPPLAARSVRADRAPARSAAISVAARHIGLVAVLAVVAPLLADDLNAAAERATRNGTQVILDAPLGLAQKVPIALAIADEFDRTPRGEVPDVGRAFDENGAGDDARVRQTRDDLLEAMRGALTRGFRLAYLIAALAALLAIVPAALALRRRGPGAGAPATRRGPPSAALAAGTLLAAGALLGGAVLAGGADLGRSTLVDPCLPRDRPPGEGFDATLQGVVLDGLAGAACDLGVSREDLVLSFGGGVGGRTIHWDPATVERAVRSGLVRSIDEAEDRGSLNGIVADVLRAVARRAPIDEVIRGTGATLDAIDRVGEIDPGALLDGLRGVLP